MEKCISVKKNKYPGLSTPLVLISTAQEAASFTLWVSKALQHQKRSLLHSRQENIPVNRNDLCDISAYSLVPFVTTIRTILGKLRSPQTCKS